MKNKYLLLLLLLNLNFTAFASSGETPTISKLITLINTNIDIKIDGLSIPSQEQILQQIQSNLSIPVGDVANSIESLQEFKGITESTNLIEVANGVMQGEVITNQKLFGIFEVQIPYQVTYDSIKGELTEKLTNNFWTYLLDLLSF